MDRNIRRAAVVGEAHARRNLSGAVLQYRSPRGLRSTLLSKVDAVPGGYTLTLQAGGPGVPYARIHEYGGVIQGKPWLRIPIHDLGETARQPEDFIRNGVIYRPRGDEIIPIAVLKRTVTMPKRPYLRPALDAAERQFAEDMRRDLDRVIEGAA